MTDGQETRAGANTEVFSAAEEGRSPRWRRRLLIGSAVLVGLLALGVAGVSYAALNYSKSYEGRILPGASIAGVDVGGMDAEEAKAAVRAAIGPQLDRVITVRWKEKTWRVTPRKLGAHSDLSAAIKAALAKSGRATFMDKMKMRVFGDTLPFKRKVAITYPRQGVRGFIEGIASPLHKKPVDATLDYSTGWVEITEAKMGRKVLVSKARTLLNKALRTGKSKVELPVKALEPEEMGESYDQVLLVRSGENKLYLYQDGEITNTWTVAPGLPEYRTPTGLFSVTEKRYMPTWVNPSPDTWGKNLPAEIPPGPGNPLGLRAINWSAPAIRFHGTSATYSLGYNASHGCVRMSNADVIELYDLIDVGTPIVSLEVGPLKPLYAKTSNPDPDRVTQRGQSD